MCSGLCGWRVRRRQTWAGSSSPSKAGQRREAQVVSGRSRSPSRLGSSGRGEGQEGDSGAAERRSRVDPAEADRFKGREIEQVSTAAWYKALRRAGIHNFRWHDLRHTWASWHVQGGTPLHVLQELGGWASYAMVQRYAHLAAEHLAPWAERLNARSADGTNPAQPPVENPALGAGRSQVIDLERDFGGP